jgi:hypothetical protein
MRRTGTLFERRLRLSLNQADSYLLPGGASCHSSGDGAPVGARADE